MYGETMTRLSEWTSKYGALMTTSQLASEVYMHPRHVRNLCKEGKLPAVKIGDRWRIDTEAMVAWIRSRRW